LRASRVWRSVFRSGTGSSTLHRALAIQQNIFLHLFATKVRKRMVRFSATWFLGTLTFGTFLILVITGILLMLYYHPSVPQAYADMKDLQFVVSSGLFLRNLHRWSAQLMVFLVFAHMFKVFYRGAYRTPREFNWVIGVVLLADHAAAQLHRIPAALGPACILGDHRWIQPVFRRAAGGQQDPLPCCSAATRSTQMRCCVSMCCTASFCRWHGHPLHRRTFLADSQRRRPLRAAVGAEDASGDEGLLPAKEVK
jgi:hypothetical protein